MLQGQLQAARDSVLQNIGIGEEEIDDVVGPGFRLDTAAFLAGVAFDSYNDPTGGVWKRYQDGVSISYTSPSCLAQVE